MLFSLWGKKDKNGNWLPLLAHLIDTQNVIEYLYDNYLSSSQRHIIGLNKQLVGYLGYCHDIGKATPAFQISTLISNATPHNIASEYLLKDTCFSQIVGMHHGYVSTKREIMLQLRFKANYGDKSWTQVRNKLFELGQQKLSQKDLNQLHEPLTQNSQILLTGLLTMADWIASDTNYFPLIKNTETFQNLNMSTRFVNGIKKWNLETPWKPKDNFDFNNYFVKSFNHGINKYQRKILQLMKKVSKPGLTIVEAPIDHTMLETALTIGEMFSAKNGENGLFYSFDTQTSTNERLKPLVKWLNAKPGTQNLTLTHSRAKFNQQYQKLEQSKHNVIVNPWYQNKKAPLAHFNISTIDQLLMMSLSQRHLALKHLAFSGKTVILDGIPIANSYMYSYLQKTLKWLGNYHVPVIILANGLSDKIRQDLFVNYLDKSVDPIVSHYPMITYSDGNNLKQQFNFKTIENKQFKIKHAKNIINLINTLPDKRIGVIVNSVSRAQEIAKLTKRPSLLIHSRFTAKDRANIETKLNAVKNEPLIIIGTQVLEQYANLQFDTLITDLAPINSFYNRLTSLKDNSTIYLVQSKADHWLYDQKLLDKTKKVLTTQLKTTNFQKLLNTVYNQVPVNNHSTDFQIRDPHGKNLRDWLSTTVPNNTDLAQVTIRHLVPSVEVVLLPDNNVTDFENYLIYLPTILINYHDLDLFYDKSIHQIVIHPGQILNKYQICYNKYGLSYQKA